MNVADIITKYPPAVIIKFKKNIAESTHEDIDTYLQKLKKLYDDRKEFNILFDSRAVESSWLSCIWCVVKHTIFLIKHEKLAAKYIKKTSLVIINPNFKKLLDIVFSMYTPQTDLIITDDIRTALSHVMDNNNPAKVIKNFINTEL